MHDTLQYTIPFTPQKAADNDFEMLCAADHPARPVQWLWPGRIPIGKVTLLVGDPGLGKSLVTLDVAARVSRGASWPDAQRVDVPGLRPWIAPRSFVSGSHLRPDPHLASPHEGARNDPERRRRFTP